MPFLRLLHNKKTSHSTANSLRTHLYILQLHLPVKRASSFTLKTLKASLTVEAAIALPLFLFFLLQIMSAMNMISVQSRLAAALHQAGNRTAFYGHLSGQLEFSVKAQVLENAGKNYLDKSCIKNGAAGISFAGTSIMKQDDRVEIYLSYRIEPIFPILAFESFAVSQCYYGRAWTGYDVESGISNFTEEEPMVYITETGTVYHTNRSCTYLNPSVETVNMTALETGRNQSGGKYYPCELCTGRSGAQSTASVYITGYGNSYHTSIMCSGLKRTIYTIPLSEAGGRRRCSKCS